MTDNGSGYISTAHAIAFRVHGVHHTRIRPGRPRTNGTAERFIQTLLNEWAYVCLYGSTTEGQPARPLPRALQLQTTTRLPRKGAARLTTDERGQELHLGGAAITGHSLHPPEHDKHVFGVNRVALALDHDVFQLHQLLEQVVVVRKFGARNQSFRDIAQKRLERITATPAVRPGGPRLPVGDRCYPSGASRAFVPWKANSRRSTMRTVVLLGPRVGLKAVSWTVEWSLPSIARWTSRRRCGRRRL